MNQSDALRMIREEIRNSMQLLLFGQAGLPQANDREPTEIIENLYVQMPSTEPRPVIHPYGMVSRAPRGTPSLVGQVGDHIGSRFVLGHRDPARPKVQAGEVALYDANGNVLLMKEGLTSLTTEELQVLSSMIKLGSDSSGEPLVLGIVLKDLLLQILTQLKELTTQTNTIATKTADAFQATFASMAGPATAPPPTGPALVAQITQAGSAVNSVGSEFDSLKSSPVEDDAILSDVAYTEKGGS